MRGSGDDRIDHPRDQHDHLADAVAGAAMLAKKPTYDFEYLAGRIRRLAAHHWAARILTACVSSAVEVGIKRIDTGAWR